MNNIGVIGLSVMGKNLALNMADNGYKVAIYNRTTRVVDEVKDEHKNFAPTYSLEEMINSLEKPRKIFLMIKAGAPVDMSLASIAPLLEEGDIIIDGGNSYFKDTIRRTQEMKKFGINFFGVGVSGGEEGARFGPAIMPGGDKEAYKHIEKILTDISAKAYDEPCCNYIATDGGGHYVKMVHNGIEYGDMELIAESYSILKNVGGLSNEEISEVFTEWNKGELDSYLIEITADILKVREGNHYLLDRILDKAAQKGTGKWTNLEAIDLGVDISVITSALNARFMSNLKDERIKAEMIISGNTIDAKIDREELIKTVRNALYIAKIVSYSQGFKLLSKAEEVYGWEFNFPEIAKIFRGGCIIRAKFLNDISEAFASDKDVKNLMVTDFFAGEINSRLKYLRQLVSIAAQRGIAIPSMYSALGYIDTYKSAELSANMIQAQRDYFGAHTFERVDKEGSFHYDWIGEAAKSER